MKKEGAAYLVNVFGENCIFHWKTKNDAVIYNHTIAWDLGASGL